MAHRGESSWERRVPLRDEAAVGRGANEGDQRTSSRTVSEARVQERVEPFQSVKAAYRPSRIESSRCPCSASERLIGASMVIQPLYPIWSSAVRMIGQRTLPSRISTKLPCPSASDAFSL